MCDLQSVKFSPWLQENWPTRRVTSYDYLKCLSRADGLTQVTAVKTLPGLEGMVHIRILLSVSLSAASKPMLVLERQLYSYKYILLFPRTQAWFPAHTRQLALICSILL